MIFAGLKRRAGGRPSAGKLKRRRAVSRKNKEKNKRQLCGFFSAVCLFEICAAGGLYGCDDTKREIGEKRPFAAHNYSSESGYCFVWKM